MRSFSEAALVPFKSQPKPHPSEDTTKLDGQAGKKRYPRIEATAYPSSTSVHNTPNTLITGTRPILHGIR